MLRANYVHWGSGAHNSGLEMFNFFLRLGPQLLVWAHNSGLECSSFVPSGPTIPWLGTQIRIGNVQILSNFPLAGGDITKNASRKLCGLGIWSAQFWIGNVQVFRLEWSGLGLHRRRRVRVECSESRDDEAARCGPEHSVGPQVLGWAHKSGWEMFKFCQIFH